MGIHVNGTHLLLSVIVLNTILWLSVSAVIVLAAYCLVNCLYLEKGCV